jgi:hypothetical protein
MITFSETIKGAVVAELLEKPLGIGLKFAKNL